jgi:hypothetical protein
MKRVVFAVVVAFVCQGVAKAGVSLIKNGSFENDGLIGMITAQDKPQYWCEVNIPESKFGGYVGNQLATHGDYSLTLYSNSGATFQVGDEATIAQQVYMQDVNQITFDVELTSELPQYVSWDPNRFTALLMVDGSVVWDSNQLEWLGNGWYHIEINDVNIRDGDPHLLTFGIKANALAVTPYPFIFYATWDFLKFDTHCGGFGYLPSDLDRDCYCDPNILDIAGMADYWLTTGAPPLYDRNDDDTVNFTDFAIITNNWLLSSNWLDYGSEIFVEPELILLDCDLNDDGIVDYWDVAEMAGDWLGVVGDCTAADINHDGVIDLYDFALLAEDWQATGTLYGW